MLSMNRRFYILTTLTAICCLLIFTLYPSFKMTQENEHKSSPYLSIFNNKKKAFATIICDPTMMEATLVSIYSLNTAFAKNPKTKADIIVLLPEAIPFTSSDIDKLENLGAQTIRTSSPAGLIHDNTCDNTIINLWALFDYQKLVYFTPDVLFEQSVDHLFDYPAGSALTTNENHSSILLLLEPNPTSFESLLRNYRKSVNVSFHQLLQTSLFIDYKKRLTSNQLLENVLVYTGPMKPWNFHSYSDSDWKKHYHPTSFYKWRRQSNELRQLFNPRKTVTHSEWKNIARQTTVCDSYLESTSNITSFPVQDQFSVMISTYNPERIQHLSLIIRHLLKSSLVHTVFVTWHNPALEVPDSIFDLIKKQDYSRVKVLTQSFDSLNNRFNPTKKLKTEAVYILDDDIYVDLRDLEFTFQAWKSRKDSIVGHFPRAHTYDPVTHLSSYRVIGKAPFSIILTKSMFIRSEYLFGFTCLLEPELHAVVDSKLNCEDLGFAMMASGISGAAPTYVRTLKKMEDFGLSKGISTNSAHMPARAQCITDFITNYWNEKDPLIQAYDSITTFDRAQLRTGDWNRVEKLIMN